MICPNCKTEFGTQQARCYEQQSAWQIIASNPKHPVWMALYALPGVLVIIFICGKFDADEVLKLATWAGSSVGLIGIANVIAKRSNG